jgi:hypothetical protein
VDDAQLSARWLLPFALLPVDDPLLLVRQEDLLALFASQFCPTQVGVREAALLERVAAKVGVSEVGANRVRV